MEPSDNRQSTPQPQANVEVNQLQQQFLLQQIRDNQNLGMGFLGGLAAACVGAIAWAAITGLSGYQIGFMAIGVGFLVGYAVQYLGKGIDKTFGIIGAVLSLLGCVGGNLLAVCIMLANQESMGLGEVLGTLNFDLAVDLMVETFSPMDLLFYGIAVYEGYRVSFRKLTNEEPASVATKRM